MLNVASPQADLITAKKLFYDEDKIWATNPEIHNMVAYHCGQAIEKLLKLVVREENDKLFDTIGYTHNISELLIKAECCKSGFVEQHKEIALNADLITKMSKLRYGEGQISRDDCHAVLTMAKNFCNEFLVEYVYPKNPSAKKAFELMDKNDCEGDKPYQFRMRKVQDVLSRD